MTDFELDNASTSWFAHNYRREMSVQDIFQAGVEYGKANGEPVHPIDLECPAGRAAVEVWAKVPVKFTSGRQMTHTELYMFIKGFKYLFKRNTK